MANFDFHANLSSIEFERLIRDMLRVKFAGTEFRTYKPGKDGGIDIKSISGNLKIVCQAKLYQNNYSSLKSALKSEVKKVERIKPQRYIIATSCSLTNQNILEIISLFQPIQLLEEDIWDRERLNDLLTLPEYSPVLKNNIKLFLTDLVVVEEAVRKVLTNDIAQFSLGELKTIADEIKYYVKTSFISEAASKLNEERILIITGIAGSGKTTSARLIANSLLNIVRPTAEFYKVTSIEEVWRCFDPNRPQVFLLDDFWGSFVEKLNEPNVQKSEKLLSFLDQVKRHKKHYVIITSRDYILKHEGIQRQPKLKNALEPHICVLKVPELSKNEKADILIRHLYCSELDRGFITSLFYNDTLEEIVIHPNFNPRLIHQFTYQVFPSSGKTDNQYSFYRGLREYLDNPDAYWNHLLDTQTDASRLLLIILTLSAGSIGNESLLVTYQNCIPFARANGLDLKLSDFSNCLILLEDNFINVTEADSAGSFDLRFKNGSVGDYMIKYLQDHISIWFPVIMSGITFYDHFVNVFTARDTRGNKQKILVPHSHRLDYKKKLLTNIWGLPNNGQDLRNEKFFAENEIVQRLLDVAEIFDSTTDADIREYLSEKTNRIIELTFSKGFFPLQSENLERLADLFDKTAKHLNFDRKLLLTIIFESICHIEDFAHFIAFSKVFTNEYKEFVAENKIRIREHFEELLTDEIDDLFNSADDPEFEIDLLIDEYYEDILKGLCLRHSRHLQAYIYEAYKVALRPPRNGLKQKKEKSKPKSRRIRKRPNADTIKKDYWKIIEQYVTHDYLFSSYLPLKEKPVDSHQSFVAQLLLLNPQLSKDNILGILKSLARAFFSDPDRWFAEATIRRVFLSDFVSPGEIDLSPVLVQQEKWFRFKYSTYAKYLIALYLKEDVSDEQYYLAIEEFAGSEHESEILTFTLQVDKDRCNRLFLKPLLTNTLDNVDFTNRQTVTISYTKKAGWSANFSFRHYRSKVVGIEYEGGSGSCHIVSTLLHFLTGKESDHFSFYADALIYYISENDTLLQEFSSYCKKYVKVEKREHWTSANIRSYELEPELHIENPQFFALADQSGWINELCEAIYSLRSYCDSM